MTTKTKTFDCVEMKNKIQADMAAEYKKQKGKFASFEEFVAAKAQDSSWVRRMNKKLGHPKARF